MYNRVRRRTSGFRHTFCYHQNRKFGLSNWTATVEAGMFHNYENNIIFRNLMPNPVCTVQYHTVSVVIN